MAYSDAQINELKEIKGLDYASATAFGERHGISPRSVVAKAKALNIPYTVKAPGAKTTKAKGDVRRKGDIATSITDLLDIELTSLDKMTSADLLALETRAKELVGA